MTKQNTLASILTALLIYQNVAILNTIQLTKENTLIVGAGLTILNILIFISTNQSMKLGFNHNKPKIDIEKYTGTNKILHTIKKISQINAFTTLVFLTSANITTKIVSTSIMTETLNSSSTPEIANFNIWHLTTTQPLIIFAVLLCNFTAFNFGKTLKTKIQHALLQLQLETKASGAKNITTPYQEYTLFGHGNSATLTLHQHKTNEEIFNITEQT